MGTLVWVKVDRLWCYRVMRESDLYEQREYAEGVTPGPDAPYTVRAWKCGLEAECNRSGLKCKLAEPHLSAK
jgi:hypothetical protein